MKLMSYALATVLGLSLMTSAAMAEIGVVDMETVIQKYNKAQELAQQSKTKEEALQKTREDLVKQLKAGEKLSPVEKKNLEDKLNKQFADKLKEYRDWSAAQQETIRGAFDAAVKQVSQSQKLDLVLPKQAVLNGGKDVTDEVLSVMNK